MVSLREGSPGFGMNTVLLHQRQGAFLLEEGMELHLVDSGFDLHGLTDIGQNLGIAVTNADGLQLALFVGLLHGPIGTDIVAHRLVDQVQIDVVQPQLLHRGLNGLLGTLVAGVLNPQLGGNEQFLRGTPHLAMALPTASSFI